MYTNTNGTIEKCPDYQGVLISEVTSEVFWLILTSFIILYIYIHF